MATGHLREESQVVPALTAWLRNAFPDRAGVHAEHLHRPAAGFSNETFVMTIRWRDERTRVVVRLPSLRPSYPDHDVHIEADVQAALGAAGIPVPRVIAVEDDARWLGAPFLVMEYLDGTVAGQAPGLDPWIVEAPREQQSRVQDEFVGVLARVHSVDWRPTRLHERLRTGIRAELAYWTAYVDWASDGSPPAALVDVLQWCSDHVPPDEPAPSLLWGDARLGNVIYTHDGRVVALLDWELASLGPAEMDVAWYVALDELTTKATGTSVAGFRGRDELLARYESTLGRRLEALSWHEIFALTRSIAVNDKQARLAAEVGMPYPGFFGDDNPMLGYVARRIERLSPDLA
jgi:aminoglycoside phosphotransferase (APT) family kinase protein